MFVIVLTYQKPMSEVEKHLAAHIEFLDQQYAAGTFVVSGRQEPRVGGIILARAVSKAELQELLEADPFYRNEVATYQIIEFVPTHHAVGFEQFI